MKEVENGGLSLTALPPPPPPPAPPPPPPPGLTEVEAALPVGSAGATPEEEEEGSTAVVMAGDYVDEILLICSRHCVSRFRRRLGGGRGTFSLLPCKRGNISHGSAGKRERRESTSTPGAGGFEEKKLTTYALQKKSVAVVKRPASSQELRNVKLCLARGPRCLGGSCVAETGKQVVFPDPSQSVFCILLRYLPTC